MTRRDFMTACGAAAALGTLSTTSSVLGARLQTPDGKAPMVHWAILESAEGQMGEMQRHARETVGPQTRNEPGTFALYGGVDPARPNVLVLLEVYQDEAAYELHVGSEPFAEYRRRRAPILKKLDIIPAEPVALEQKTSGTGTFLIARRFEVEPDRRAEYCNLALKEARRAVESEKNVLGAFVTAEKDAPNVFRTMVVCPDEDAWDAYADSPEYRAYLSAVEPWLKPLEETVAPKTIVLFSMKGTNAASAE